MIVVAVGCFLMDVVFQVYGVPETTNWEIFANANHSLVMATLFFECYQKFKKPFKYGGWILTFLSVFYLFDMFNELRFINYEYEEYKRAVFHGEDTISVAMLIMLSIIFFFAIDFIKNKYNLKG